MTLVAGIGVGLIVGRQVQHQVKGGTEDAAASATASAATQPEVVASAAAKTDQFGRRPGDEHFGHNHPPKPAAFARPAVSNWF